MMRHANQQKSSWILLLIAITLIAGGCTNAANSVKVSSNGKATARTPNTLLSWDIEVISTKYNYIGDKAEAVFVLESSENESKRISVQFKWYDQDNIEMDSAAKSWEPMVIHAEEIKTIKDMAPRPGAKTAEILIRDTDDQDY